MSIIIAKQINESGHVDLQILKYKYPKICVEGINILVFINRIFNEKHKIVRAPQVAIEAPIIGEKSGSFRYPKLDLDTVMLKYGIPKGYYIEVIASNFITKTNEGTGMIPIFPNEMILDCDYGISGIIKKEVEIIQKVAEVYEIIGKLYTVGMGQIADDLREAIIRLEKGDVDGSIKFFRKVIEGFKSRVSEDILKSSNRVDAYKNYLKKVFHLLSNFGEHAGTEALMSEAVFSREITISTAKYVISKMEE